ncbi:HPr family phosphocarrier protein [Thiolapillus brandeum]|uniref:Phosphocarrier protein HPr n=1 Tax=Thiolapillus brandeum TaxID=1076588 RepID=A0A7U6JG42_9GAMM|nr:HPr family phosphocarrier protein [Thiolapillus brandeum]BAO43374.1 phosphocarrier protein HPr [Thiolapillus brandeum]
MKSAPVVIPNRLGLHARAAAKLVSTASGFSSQVYLERNGNRINGKSIMGVMMLAASQGSEITIITEGDDEGPALESLLTLVEDGFGEEQ